MLRIAHRITGDLVEAEEVRQTVFLRLLESPSILRSPESFPTWIRRCAANASITTVRRRRRQARMAVWLTRVGWRVLPNEPAVVAAEADERERLACALAQLGPHDRAMLALRFEEGLTLKELADTLGKPASSVKSQLYRATQRLRRLLVDKHGDD